MDPLALLESAAAAFRAGNVREALIGFRTLHQAAPAHAGIKSALALMLLADRQHREALDLLVTLPETHDGMLAASKCAQALNDIDSARRYASRALELEPNSTDARLQIANLRVTLGMQGQPTERDPHPPRGA